MFGGNFAPYEYSYCNGAILNVSQYAALFALLGASFGGNGSSTFGLPNLVGAVPMGQGQGAGLTSRLMGRTGGTTAVTLTAVEMAAHTHAVSATTAAGTGASPSGALWAENKTGRQTVPDYYDSTYAGDLAAMRPLGDAGGNLPHNNLAPYLVVSFVIALTLKAAVAHGDLA